LNVGQAAAIVIATRVTAMIWRPGAALRTPAPYVGLLGSAKKREAMAKSLINLGFSTILWLECNTPVACPGRAQPRRNSPSVLWPN